MDHLCHNHLCGVKVSVSMSFDPRSGYSPYVPELVLDTIILSLINHTNGILATDQLRPGREAIDISKKYMILDKSFSLGTLIVLDMYCSCICILYVTLNSQTRSVYICPDS